MTAINETTIVTSTLSDFVSLNYVAAGTRIRRDRIGAEYMFTNQYDDVDGVHMAWLLNQAAGVVIGCAITETDQWSIVRDEDGDPVFEPETVRLLARTLIATERSLRSMTREREGLRLNARHMRSDWELLNEKLTQESNDRDWCSVYDQLIDQWNGEFQLLQLEPRKRDFEVEVEITATWTVRVPVEGFIDGESAEEWVSDNLTPEECMARSSDTWSSPDDTSMEVQGSYDA